LSKAETRRRIVDAAMDLFGKKGYVATTTREIASKAGVTEVTIFRHFGTKENLFETGIKEGSPVAILGKELEARLSGHLSQDLATLADAILSIALTRADLIRLGMIEAPTSPELTRVVRQIPARFKAFIAEYLLESHREGRIVEGDFAVLAEIFYSVLLQYVLSLSSLGPGDSHVKREKLVSELVELFQRALEPKPD